MYFIALLFITILNSLLGQGVLRLFKIEASENYRPLVALVIGTFCSIFLYSLYITSGKTIHLSFIFLALTAWGICKKEGHINLGSNQFLNLKYLKSNLIFLGILSGWLCYFYLVFTNYTFG